MSDVECPYCGAGQEINHDDGYGYEEDRQHSQQCISCEKHFAYTTSISFYYEAEQADCLNGAPHKFKPTKTYPKEFSRMVCADCGEERECTEAEMAEIMGAGK